MDTIQQAEVLRSKGAEAVLIDTEKIEKWAEKQDDPVEALDKLGVLDQMEEALEEEGSQVEVTPEAFTDQILGTDNYEALADAISIVGAREADITPLQVKGRVKELDRRIASLDKKIDDLVTRIAVREEGGPFATEKERATASVEAGKSTVRMRSECFPDSLHLLCANSGINLFLRCPIACPLFCYLYTDVPERIRQLLRVPTQVPQVFEFREREAVVI